MNKHGSISTPTRFLIVEDDEASALYLKLMLRNYDELEYLGSCTSSIESVVKINQLKPDLVFMDINIRGLEGPEIVRFLENSPKLIIVSSHEQEYMEKFEIGYSSFLRKPITEKGLSEAIEQAMTIAQP